MEAQEKSYLSGSGTKIQAKNLTENEEEQINVPWSVNTEIQDERGNVKQISAVGNAALSVSSKMKTFYEEYAGTVLPEVLTTFIQRYGWQFLKPEGEKVFTSLLSDGLEGATVEKFGLIHVREWDIDPALEGKGLTKLGQGRTLYQNLSWDERTGPSSLS